MRNLFSITNKISTNNKCHKVICILGIKFAFKNKNKYENCKDIDKPCRCIFNKDWIKESFMISPQNYNKFKNIPNKPIWLNEFIFIVNQLCYGFLHVRIDFIVVDNKLIFREMTFASGSGLSKIEPKSKSLELGQMIKLPTKKENKYETLN